MKKLSYNYHDTFLEYIKFTDTTLTFHIELYPVYYPEVTKIKLTFKNVNNQAKIQKWIELLELDFEPEEDTIYTRVDAIKLLHKADHPQILYWTIECDHIERLHFQSTDFREQEISKPLPVDEQLLTICKHILGENLSLESWREIESDNLFQTEKYRGGFEAVANEFVFSYYDDKEYLFQLSIQQVVAIVKGKIKSVRSIMVEVDK